MLINLTDNLNSKLVYIDLIPTNNRYKFKKTIHSLKQILRTRFHRFNNFLLDFNFKNSPSDTSKSETVVINLLLYINNIILTDSSSDLSYSFIDTLFYQFIIKNINNSHYF